MDKQSPENRPAGENRPGRERGFLKTLRRVLLGQRPSVSSLEEELVMSPSRTALRNFKENKLAMTGMFVFVFIVLACIILPFFFPINKSYVDTTQVNAAPGYYFLKIPKQLQGNAIDADTGATFGAGVDKDGNVHIWGKLAGATLPEKLYRVPEGVKFKDVACGLDHVIAIGQDGELYTWGNDRLGLKSIPMDVQGREIVQIEAGENISVALGVNGKLYIWGSENIINIKPNLAEGLGKIVKFALCSTTAVVVTDEKNVAVLTQHILPFTDVPAVVQGHAIDVAAAKQTAAALLDDGRVVAWGSADYGLLDVPEQYQGHVTQIVAGRYHFSVLLDDGSVGAWGMNDFDQAKAPKVTNAVSISAGFFNTTAVLSDGRVVGWGLRGYALGTDHFGRDVFVRLLAGGRITLTVGAISVIIAAIIGIIIGGVSGYYGGKVDMLLMRITEVISAIPFLPLAIILSAIIGNRISEGMRIVMIMLILGVLSWPSLARLTRAQILAERENEFVTAAKAMGVRESGIIFRHILPNVIAVVLVSLTLDLATCMLIESTLSYLGFGVQEPNATWGNMLYSCVDSTVIRRYWWRWISPAVSLGLATISLNAVGDGLRDAIDPKSNDR
jgi:peptide/nickel transport system permease protein